MATTTHASAGSTMYARALAEAIQADGDDPGAGKALLPGVESLLESFAQAWETDNSFRGFFLSTDVPRAEKEAAMNKLVEGRFPKLLGNFLRLLQHKRRLPLIPEIAIAFRGIVDEALGRRPLSITTAVPVPESDFREWVRLAQQRVGSGAVVEHIVRPEIIAGCIIRMGDEIADVSARRRLADLKKKIIERGKQHYALQS